MDLDSRTTPDELDASGRHRFADALGDTPESVISVHLLRRGLCRAHVSGTPEDFAAAIIQPTGDPGEPIAFGEDVRAVWEILRRTTGWWCVNVPAAVAPGLAATMERELRCSVRLYDDVYHTQTRTAPSSKIPPPGC